MEKSVLSALAQTYPADHYEIIVADGSSSDGTEQRIRRLMEQHPGRIKLLVRPPLGPSASRNAAVAESRGEILALLDSDCTADRHWIEAGVAALSGKPQVGMLQGRTLPPPDAQLPTRARYVRVEHANFVHEACNMFYRREAFASVNGFSKDFYMEAKPKSKSRWAGVLGWVRHYALVMKYSGEDTDLGWSVLNAGWEKAYCREALVYHDVRILSWSSWLIDEGCYAYGAPRLVKRYPVSRAGLYHRFFLNRAQAGLCALAAGVILSTVNSYFALLCLPYFLIRATEPTVFFRSWKRPLLSLMYLPRDFTTFAILLFSSFRHGRIVV